VIMPSSTVTLTSSFFMAGNSARSQLGAGHAVTQNGMQAMDTAWSRAHDGGLIVMMPSGQRKVAGVRWRP